MRPFRRTEGLRLPLLALCMVIGCGPAADSGERQAFAPLAAPGASPDLCAGLVKDKIVRPVSPLPRPALRTPVTDPAFGTRIIRITDVDPAEGAKPVIKPVYSTIQSWNADESLLLLWHRGHGYELYDGRTYAFLRRVRLQSPSDIEQVYWDPLDADLLYYPSKYKAEPRLMRYRISTDRSELVRHFGQPPTDCPTRRGRRLSAGRGLQDMSWGAERIIGLRCGATKFLYSISSDRVLGLFHDDSSSSAPAASFDGALAYYRGRVLNQRLEEVRDLGLAKVSEHACLGRGASGALYGAVDFDGSPPGTLIVYDLATGEKRPIISRANGWGYPPSSTHISGLARRGPPGWFAVSVVGDPPRPCLLCQEILLANADTGEVCRVAHHRSWARHGGRGYWAEPHVGLSPSGTRLIFGSDWGGGPTVDTYVVELPAYHVGPKEKP